MKEIIPLKKDIIFKTKVSEITAIDVEHNFKINDELVEGYLTIDGTYKMTEASLIEEEYHYEIPFSIAIGNNIIKDSINIEISDFKYELDKDVMKIDAQLEFICDKEEEIIKSEDEIILEDKSLEEYFKDDIEKEEDKKIEIKEEIKEIDTDETIKNITNNVINTEEKYNTYKVYIVREGDTLDNICMKYNVKYDDIKEYNDLTEINVGDKIIIPFLNE